MAQKETSSKSRRWLGLSGAAVLVANLVLTGTTIAFQQEGEVNHALGIEGAGASYGGTEFSADGTLSDASYEKYIEAAYQFCEQEEEEGSVLLYNRNNALPLSESERNVTVFGRGSIDPVFRSTAGGSSTNPDYQKTPVDALQDAGFNVNQTVLDAYASAEAPKERSVSSVGEYDPALFTGSVTDSFASYGDVAFVTLSRFATEGNDLAMVNDEGKRTYAGKSILQIFFEVFFGESQMHRLYLYYCYQLGILPKKQQPHINRPELERIWKDTEKILAEHAFVHDHEFPSLQAIVDYRKGLSQRIETFAAQRAEIVKQMRRKDAPPELADRRAMLTCKIAELRKEDKIAEGAIKRIQRTCESNRIDQENQYTNNKNRRRNRSRQR